MQDELEDVNVLDLKGNFSGLKSTDLKRVIGNIPVMSQHLILTVATAFGGSIPKDQIPFVESIGRAMVANYQPGDVIWWYEFGGYVKVNKGYVIMRGDRVAFRETVLKN